MALLCLLTIMAGLLITLWIAYDAAPKWQAQYTTHYDNGASLPFSAPRSARLPPRAILTAVASGLPQPRS